MVLGADFGMDMCAYLLQIYPKSTSNFNLAHIFTFSSVPTLSLHCNSTSIRGSDPLTLAYYYGTGKEMKHISCSNMALHKKQVQGVYIGQILRTQWSNGAIYMNIQYNRRE